MLVPVTSMRSIGVTPICALAGGTAKVDNAPAANNCATASGNAFTFADMSDAALHLLEKMHVGLADRQRFLTLLETHRQMTAVVACDAGN